MERYQEVMVVLSQYVMKNHLKRTMAEKLRWRHIRWAIKPRYLGNHASEIKQILWNAISVSWSLFQNVSWKSPDAPPSGEITMTSYPACNKTSLSRKPSIADKKLLWITIMKSWSLSNFYLKNSKYKFKKLISLYMLLMAWVTSIKQQIYYFHLTY